MNAKKYKPRLEVLASPEIVAQRTLEYFIAEVKKTLAAKEAFYAALSGGNTPKHFFELLGTQPQSHNLPWDKIHLFWVDERYVPVTSPQSNYKLAADTFLNKVSIPQQNIHRIPTEMADVHAAASKYEEIIKSVFNLHGKQKPEFDLITLGMGTDGHTGSMFPNSGAYSDTDDFVRVVYIKNEKLSRLTLTSPVLCRAKHLLVMVQGREKAAILKEVITGEPDAARYPIHILWPVLDKVTWLVDKEAAAYL